MMAIVGVTLKTYPSMELEAVMEKLKIDIAVSVSAIQRTCSGHAIHV